MPAHGINEIKNSFSVIFILPKEKVDSFFLALLDLFHWNKLEFESHSGHKEESQRGIQNVYRIIISDFVMFLFYSSNPFFRLFFFFV